MTKDDSLNQLDFNRFHLNQKLNVKNSSNFLKNINCILITIFWTSGSHNSFFNAKLTYFQVLPEPPRSAPKLK